MATKKKKDPLDLVRSKQATIASLPLCMDPEAFSDHGLAKQALDEAEGKLAGLRARQNALGDNAVDEEIASIEADLAGVVTASQKRKMEARLATLKRRRSSSALARVEYDIEEQEKKAKAAQAEFDKTEKAVEEATVTFKMRAIPAKRQRHAAQNPKRERETRPGP